MAETSNIPAAGTRGILHDHHAEAMQRNAGTAYRPSNGTEGAFFEGAWCAGCRRGGEHAACRIHMMALAHDIEDPGYPREWIYGSDGQPCCTAFSDKHAPRPAYRCKATPDLLDGVEHNGMPEVRT